MDFKLKPLSTEDETAQNLYYAVRLLMPLLDHRCLYKEDKYSPCGRCKLIRELKKTGIFQDTRAKLFIRLDSNKFGKNLIKLLKEKKIRKLHLSNRTRINRVTIDKAIKGSNPKLKTIVKILNELTDVTLEDLTT